MEASEQRAAALLAIFVAAPTGRRPVTQILYRGKKRPQFGGLTLGATIQIQLESRERSSRGVYVFTSIAELLRGMEVKT